ncbi:hypothetical protein [Mycolicibacterium sp.]|uniref:hypothetical protein n=1 Tax=Mycolicibacterium sp. TaxID=2320850 RepID=UPI0037C74004
MTTGSADDVMQRYRVPIVLAGVTVVAFILAMAFDASFFAFVAMCTLIGAVGMAARINLAPAKVPVIVSTVLVSDEVRRQNLQNALSHEVAVSRGRIESVTPYSAVLVTGQKVNHILHLLVSVLLCGLWLPIWLIISLNGGEKRHVLTVDPCGNVTRS